MAPLEAAGGSAGSSAADAQPGSAGAGGVGGAAPDGAGGASGDGAGSGSEPAEPLPGDGAPDEPVTTLPDPVDDPGEGAAGAGGSPSSDGSGTEEGAAGSAGDDSVGDQGGDAEEEPADEEPADEDDPDEQDESDLPDAPAIQGGLESFKLAIIGSSTAAGEGASNGSKSWVGLLEADLQAVVTTQFSLSNFAVSGYSAYELMPGSGVKGSIDDALREQPDLLVIALAGSNDLTPEITTEKFMSQLVTLRDTATAAGIPTFFMSTLPKNLTGQERDLLDEWGQRMKESFSACWIPGVTAPYSPCYIDVYALLEDPSSRGLLASFDSGDGQHPNDAGHSLLFRSAEAIVKPYVCAKTACR